jgi:hypothetical protein
MSEVLLVHLVATWAMIGFAWTIQILVYPAMAGVPSSAFGAYEQHHQRRVLIVLLLFAPVEVVTGGRIVLEAPDDPLRWVAGVLLVLIWTSTAVWFAPVHGQLARAFDASLLRRLTAANWARTVAWTARGLIVLAVVLAAAFDA